MNTEFLSFDLRSIDWGIISYLKKEVKQITIQISLLHIL